MTIHKIKQNIKNKVSKFTDIDFRNSEYLSDTKDKFKKEFFPMLEEFQKNLKNIIENTKKK